MQLLTIQTRCPICGKVHCVAVDPAKEDLVFKVHEHEIYAQDAFPELSDAERELLITGIDEERWNRMFAEEE